MESTVEIGITNEQGFRAWLMTDKGLSENWSKDTAWYVNRMLVREDIPFPEKADAEALAVKILRSDLSKSHKRNSLRQSSTTWSTWANQNQE